VTSGVTAPRGFRAAGVKAGIKEDARSLDVALVVADTDCAAAGVFTTNRAAAPPVAVAREHLTSGRARALVVNSGCANAATGSGGRADAEEMAAVTAKAVGCAVYDVLVASTGVIGVRLPMERLRASLPGS